MNGTELKPDRITSPFQLMAAWFSMLVLLVSVLLAGAGGIEKPEWAAGFLVIFASIVTVIVIACVTVMLTKYRPHLQEGEHYAKWLKDQSRYVDASVISNTSPFSLEQPRLKITRKLSSRKEIITTVIDLPSSDKIVASLENQGFMVEIYEAIYQKDGLERNRGIWVGERVSPKDAIQAIKIALETWPELMYLSIPGDLDSGPPAYVHDEIFFGGSNSAVRGYTSWSNSELKALNENMSVEQFHALIRERAS